jgi:hypothetical protein
MKLTKKYSVVSVLQTPEEKEHPDELGPEVQSHGDSGPGERMPPLIYHVTPDAEAIMGSKKFLPASQLATDQQVMGGASDDAVSFTTLQNAENYQEGLEIYRHAAQGAYDWNDKEMMYALCNHYGLDYAAYQEIMNQMEDWLRRSGEKDSQQIVSEFLSKVSFYSFLHARKIKSPRWLPLVLRLGASFPSRLVQSPGIAILGISPREGHGKPGPQVIKWAASEHEWKVYDPENFDYSTLKVVSHGLD